MTAELVTNSIDYVDCNGDEWTHAWRYRAAASQIAKLEAELAACQLAYQTVAERCQWMIDHATQQADACGPIFRIDIRRNIDDKTLFNVVAAIDATRGM